MQDIFLSVVVLAHVILGAQAAVLPFLYGTEANDTILARGDDVQNHITLPASNALVILGNSYTDLYVDTNGVIWLGWVSQTTDIPSVFPVEIQKQLIACYWADVDTSIAGTQGYVSYRLSDSNDDWTRAMRMLQQWQPDATLDPSSDKRLLLISTWNQVTFSGGSTITPTNTFQCAVMSDGKYGYVLFAFGELTWTNGIWEGGDPQTGLGGTPAAVGIDTGLVSNIINFTLPGSMTDDVLALPLVTNIPKFGLLGAEMSGWHVLADRLNSAETKQFTLSPGVQYKTCYAQLDPHYYTFDGVHLEPDYDYRGVINGQSFWAHPPGTYVMAATTNCKPESFNYVPFAMYADVAPPVGAAPPYTYTAIQGATVVFYFDTIGVGAWPSPLTIHITSNQFTVNGDVYSPPNDNWNCNGKLCSNPNKKISYTVSVKNSGGGCYQVSTNFGFNLLVCPYNTFRLTLPVIDDLVENIMGYCGNMNGNTEDEERCPQPQSALSGMNYWKCWAQSNLRQFDNPLAEGEFKCPVYDSMQEPQRGPNKVETPQAGQTDQRLRSDGEDICALMKDTTGPFKDCQTLSTLAFIYGNCVGDMMATNGDHVIKCFHYSALSQACMAANPNTVIDWRDAAGCGPNCTANSHYESKASGCQATCADPLGDQMCGQLPTEGCVCDTGYVLNGQQCVKLSECVYCVDDNGGARKVGDTWRTKDCGRICTCINNGQTQCTVANCNANAHCGIVGQTANCACNDGYYGDGVSCFAINNCWPTACQNGGTCVSQEFGYRCMCATGYTDFNCSTPIDYCSSTPCHHNGVCNNVVGGYTCDCGASEYTGLSCEIEINHCLSYPCQNSGTCNALLGGYTCSCGALFFGLNCEFDVNSSISPTTEEVTEEDTTQPPLIDTTSNAPAPDTTSNAPEPNTTFTDGSTLITSSGYWPDETSTSPPEETTSVGNTETTTQSDGPVSLTTSTTMTPTIRSTTSWWVTPPKPVKSTTVPPVTDCTNFFCSNKDNGNYALGCSNNYCTCSNSYAWRMECPAHLIYDSVTDTCESAKVVPGCAPTDAVVVK